MRSVVSLRRKFTPIGLILWVSRESEKTQPLWVKPVIDTREVSPESLDASIADLVARRILKSLVDFQLVIPRRISV